MTSDLYLASFLSASGVKMRDVDRRNPNRVNFVFPPVEESLLLSWEMATATVNAVAFANAIKRTKSMVYRS